MQLGMKDLYEDYDIRINKRYTSLLISHQPTDLSAQDHTEALPTKRIKVLPTDEYLKKYSLLSEKTSTILPPGCRYIETLKNGGRIYVIEEPPQFRTVAMSLNFDLMYEEIKSKGLLEEYDIKGWLESNVTQTSSTNRYYKLNLAFPYVVFVIYINEKANVEVGYSFIRTSQMIGLSDYLLKMPMSNIAESQAICFGDRLNSESYNTDHEAVRSTIDIFWTSIFNTDYTYNINAYKNVVGISNFLEWQYLSRKDPMFVYVADWVRYNHNIFELINIIKERRTSRSNNNGNSDTYTTFLKTFTKPAIIGEIQTGKINKRVDQLYYDITTGFYITDILKLEIGDSFENVNKTKKYFVISFIGIRGDDPKIIRISYNEKVFNFTLNRKSIQYLKERIEEQRFIKTIDLNGFIIKSGDIIKYIDITGSEVCKKIYYIRKCIDGRPEIRMGNRYYLANNLPKGLEKVDTDNLSIYDMNLKIGDEYLYSHSNASDSPIIKQIERCIFDSIDVASNNDLMFKFKSMDPQRQNADLAVYSNNTSNNRRNRRIYPKLDYTAICQNSKATSVGRSIMEFIEFDDNGSTIPSIVYKTPTHYNINVNALCEKSKSENIKNLIKNDTTFEIDTHSGIVKFEVGDLVVVANWTNPLSVLDIKRIEAFKIEEKVKTINISFILANKLGNLSEELFVTGSNVRIGYIRKITTKFQQVSAGMKIKAEKGRISNFPKKDYNIIVGIITDGPQPLVLCSNGCTLWYEDVIENFKLIPINSILWKSNDHVEFDLKKIKLQSGDIAIPNYYGNVNDPGLLMVQSQMKRALRYHPLDSYSRRYDSYSANSDMSLHKDCTLHCIPNPRVSKSEQDKNGFIRAVPNFHGGFYLSENSHFLYVNDSRSLINV